MDTHPTLQRPTGPIGWLRREGCYFTAAVQFLTRLPVPELRGFEPRWLDCAAGYFPIVGAIVGTISAATFLAASAVLPGALPAILAIAAGILATGAFHEDGLADTADGLGGGQTREQRLLILKDSRIGTYGAAAMVTALALKVASLAALAPMVGALALLVAHTGGRIVPVVASAMLPYAGETRGAKVAPIEPSPARLTFAVLTGLAPFLLLPLWASLAALAIASLAAAVVLRMAVRSIGGHTGDVLGASEQAFETAVLVAVAGMLAAR
jgi:adenosylcobinamide-GDP ribazoletransferase